MPLLDIRASSFLILVAVAPCLADPAPAIHYAPAENLEHLDVTLIDQAERKIDIAAFVLTDRPVMAALLRAAQRGVKIRIYMVVGVLASGTQRRSSGNSSAILRLKFASSLPARP
jgi:phosphatidylserine/phosphatidylglycerophosphate/cardiolipin synthase-like enzyme